MRKKINLNRATINIEVLEKNTCSCKTEIVGPTYMIMIGLTNAIKEVEELVPEESRSDYRAKILKLLNDRS